MMRPIYRMFYNYLSVPAKSSSSDLVLLTDTEIKKIVKKERIAVAISAILGALGVVVLYVPFHVFPAYFPKADYTVFGFVIKDISFVFFVYLAILVALELFLLTLLNIWCAHEVASITGFINSANKRDESMEKMLIDLGLEKRDKSSLSFGINPHYGLSKFTILTWNMLYIFKATLSNLAFKFIIRGFLGRYAIQMVQDFAGIPIYAIWNALATKKILKESRVIIMGDNITNNLVSRIKVDQDMTEDFKSLLYQTLCYVAISKREFHYNHFLLSKKLFDRYDLEPLNEPLQKKDFLSKLDAADKEQQEVCRMIIAVGFILDGELSAREQIRIAEMRKEGIFDFTIKEMKQYNSDFINGKGIEAIVTKYIA